MDNRLNRSSGIALIAGSFVMVFTMALHPAGGSFEHLLKSSTRIIVTHSLAILVIPFILFGFWGLKKRLDSELVLSTIAFIIISFGLVAVMCAAATNGLALPFFIKHFEGSSAQVIDSIRPVISYNSSLNHAFDFIYIGATCLAILFWSIAMFKTKIFSRWIGILGILLTIAVIIMLCSGFVFVNLQGFRVFIAGIVCWIIVVGYALIKTDASIA